MHEPCSAHSEISLDQEGFRKPQVSQLLEAESRTDSFQCSCIFQPNKAMTLILLGIRRLLLLLLWTSAPQQQPKWQVQLLLQQHFIGLIPNEQSLTITFFFLIQPFNSLPSATGCHSSAVLHLYPTTSSLPPVSLLPGVHSLHSLLYWGLNNLSEQVRVQRTFWFKNRASTWNSWQEADNKQKGLFFPPTMYNVYGTNV